MKKLNDIADKRSCFWVSVQVKKNMTSTKVKDFVMHNQH